MSNAVARFTPEQTIELITAYKATPSKQVVETFAEKFGRSVQSIVAKLSREGVYVKAEKRESEKKSVLKADLVWALELAVGREMPSLHNATMKDLEALMNVMRVTGNTTGE